MTKSPLVRALTYLLNQPTSQLSHADEFLDASCTEIFRPIAVMFPVAFTLHALTTYQQRNKPTKKLTTYISKLQSYLFAQAEGKHSFNYWTKESELFTNFRLPDDIDDTACAASALLKSGANIHENFILHAINLETQVGGPYRTWYVPAAADVKQMWSDVDPIVNAHFLYCCGIYGIKLPHTREYLIQCINTNKISSPYYPYELIFYFYLSRYLTVVDDAELRSLISTKLQICKLAKLTAAEKLLYALCCSYLNLPVPQNLLSEILDMQQADGSLPPVPMCYGFDKAKGVHTYAGNTVSTTALFVELLSLQLQEQPATDSMTAIKSEIAQQLKLIVNEIAQLSFAKEIKELLPLSEPPKALYVPISLAYDLKPELSSSDINQIRNLSVAMYFAWAGYTVLDDMLDNQKHLSELPIATSLIRLSWKYLLQLNPVPADFFTDMLHALQVCDEYYHWEITNARFDPTQEIPKAKNEWAYDYIAQRMQPYLTAISYVPELLGLSSTNRPLLSKFFRAQVIIDQLNDDAHDWQEDQQAGIMTYVLSLLHRQNNAKSTPAEVFARGVLPEVIRICELEQQRAQSVIAELGNSPFLHKLLQHSIAPILQAKSELVQMERMIKQPVYDPHKPGST